MWSDWYKSEGQLQTKPLKSNTFDWKCHYMRLDKEILSKAENSNPLVIEEHIAAMSGIWRNVTLTLRLQRIQQPSLLSCHSPKVKIKRILSVHSHLQKHKWLTFFEFQWAVVKNWLALSLSTTHVVWEVVRFGCNVAIHAINYLQSKRLSRQYFHSILSVV